jgi:hypothetical protein
MKTIDNNSVALAGEFAVLSRLMLEGWIANLALGRTKGVDILLSHPETKKSYRLEVKTKYRESPKVKTASKMFGEVLGGWIMDEKNEKSDPSLFYCFVIISVPNELALRFFIIPSAVVADYLKAEHAYWLKQSKLAGRLVKNSSIRTLRIGFEQKQKAYPLNTPLVERYENNWDFSP